MREKSVEGVERKLELTATDPAAGVTIATFYTARRWSARRLARSPQRLLEATVLVVVLLVLFLGNLRAALDGGPRAALAALITFILMRIVGMSAT